MLSNKKIEGYEAVSSCLNNAESAYVNVGTNRYDGRIERLIPGKAIVFKVNNLDDNLVKTPDGFSNVLFKVTGRDKTTSNFQTRIISKKLPRLLLLFPVSETEKIERTHSRVHANIATPIILKKRAYDLIPLDNNGMGTIENVSEGGCSISTRMEVKVGDTIEFFMPVITDDKLVDIELHGIICNIDKTPDGSLRSGICYSNLDRQTDALVKAYMVRRRKHLTTGSC